MKDTANGTIRKRIEELNKKLDEKESAIQESGDLPFWKGRRIISVEQWQSIANRKDMKNVSDLFQIGLLIARCLS